MGLQDNIFPQLLSRAERATTVLTDAELLGAATTLEEGEKWTQLCHNLKYILINITSGPAATVCRQHQDAMGLEVYRQLRNTCWNKKHRLPHTTPQTKIRQQRLWRVLLNMAIWACTLWAWQQCTTSRPRKESCSHEWGNRTTSTTLTPQRQHNTNICRSEDNSHGVLQDHDSVLKTPTTVVLIGQYNLGGRPAPMDIGATYKGKGKGKGKNKGKGYGKGNKGKGYQQGKGGKGYGGYGAYNKGKVKGKQQPWYQPKGGDKGNKGKAKDMPSKEKERIQQRCATDVANQATWQRIAEQRCTICPRHHRNRTKM